MSPPEAVDYGLIDQVVTHRVEVVDGNGGSPKKER
jgi:ATP-dependent protease ClpP protease subunit